MTGLLLALAITNPTRYSFHDCMRLRGDQVSTGIVQTSMGGPLVVSGIVGVIGGVVLLGMLGNETKTPGAISIAAGAVFAGIGAPMMVVGSSTAGNAIATECRRPPTAQASPPATTHQPPAPAAMRPPELPPIPLRPTVSQPATPTAP